jgi:hypothetical protein
MRQLKDDIRERNEERDLLNQRVDTIIKRSDAAAEKARNLHKAMVEQLDVHFDNLGVLPKLHDIKAAPDVLVSGPAMAPDATATKEPQQPEANLNEVEVLTQAWNAILDKLLENDARFERFRDSFDAELHRYIAEQLFKQPYNLTRAQLETQSGPIWLSRHQAITSELAQVTKEYNDLDRALMQARRDEKIAAPEEALRPDDGAYIEPYQVDGVVEDVEAATFGRLISGRRLEGIESWLWHDPRSPILGSQSIAASTPRGVSISISESDKSSPVGGWLRAKIDDYEQYVGRVPAANDSKSQVIAVPIDDCARTELMKDLFAD